MLSDNFLRGRRRRELSDEEKAGLDEILTAPVTLPKRKVVTSRGDVVNRSTFLISGFMCRYMDGADGHRQLVSVQTPGDFVDLHGYPLQRLDHDVATISECQVAYAPHDKLTELIERLPHLGRVLWFSTLLDAALHREWIFRLGRLDAVGRVAHMLSETYCRLDAVGLVEDGTFAWPLTQQDLGEACGLTSVHVNRTLRVLREAGMVEVSDRMVTVMDFDRLANTGEFQPDYLYLEDEARDDGVRTP
ncbi:MAG: Crp/Fnr family transcriptional regulator [Sphingomonas sp.]|uniref:Crp/Fnr family transcriptional regulator n=1 Tax=Sphingomonas sp. TaxID=28214 RepID=UPI001ACBC895|nr:Crp/Fnr family transcriptional regulator [Sphingomonas sp.]MBN8815133.1 Crp/Fnr family transcriptional regulator [Sphingomonas sp.]